MTDKPFCLEDKRREILCLDGGRGWGYPDPDVKQAIKLLKEEIEECVYSAQPICEVNGVIDKIFGKTLIQ